MALEISILFITAPDEATAGKLAKELVERRLAACANIIPKIRSIYRWQEKIHDESEVLLIVKTARGSVENLRQLILSIHPYDTPEIVELAPHSVFEKYAAWVNDNSS